MSDAAVAVAVSVALTAIIRRSIVASGSIAVGGEGFKVFVFCPLH